MSFEIEKNWIADAGYRAVAARIRNSHLCGYVGIPKEHPLYEMPYSKRLAKSFWQEIVDRPFRGSSIDMLLASHDYKNGELGPTLSYYIDVHGGVTYSGGNDTYPIEDSGLWWFGFDCGHFGDSPEVQDLNYVVKECESMAKQLKDFSINHPEWGQK